jgi:protein-tyrosine phosphatase
MAEGLLRHHLQRRGFGDRVVVDSAGTRASQAGSRPDLRAQKVAALRGINLSRGRSRRMTDRDLTHSDFVFVMDEGNMRDLLRICPSGHEDKISFLLSHQPGQPLLEVPDPYFGSAEGFERVYDILESAMDGVVAYLVPQLE